MQRGVVVFTLISLLLVTGSGACRTADATWREIQNSGVLRVGVDPTYPPFAQTDGVSLWGIDIDLARALAAGMGVDVEFVLFGYDGLYDALGTAQVDLLISALVIAPERARDFAYSDPYFNAGEQLVLPTTETEIGEMADLSGRSLAVELGARGHVEATTWERRLPELTIIPYSSADAALAAVQDGTADAALVDAISGWLFLTQAPGLRRVTPAVTVEPFAVVTRAADEQLLLEVNRILGQLKDRGELEEIINAGMSP